MIENEVHREIVNVKNVAHDRVTENDPNLAIENATKNEKVNLIATGGRVVIAKDPNQDLKENC